MITFSQKYKAVQARIRKVPRLAEDVASLMRKGDAYDLVMYWRNGIKNKGLRLATLKPATVARKRKLGYPNPTAPLYGLGESAPDTYVKGMRVWRKKNGWTVHMMRRRHVKADVTLDVLFQVHEHGAVIDTGKAVVRIPARPAMRRAYEKVIRDVQARDPNALMQKACGEFLRGARQEAYAKVRARAARWEAEVGKAT